ncbi:MAG: metallophosphoesterase [Verrucomicrobia bacterium]|nr:metallophosphoesterase [Verrucomicrobiota bacterium]
MSRILVIVSIQPLALLCLYLMPALMAISTLKAESIAKGVVFHDLNRNGVRDAMEPGLEGVRVSNQQTITSTDAQGVWSLPAEEGMTFFVLKPAHWQTPVNEHQLPQFYYTFKPEGSPASEFPGVAATGPLPSSIDFALHPSPEPDRFEAVFFGDPQPRDMQEVQYIGHDVVEELLTTTARFGVTLGDIVFDDLGILEPLNATIALIGIPWFNVIGNHDMNLDAASDRDSDETFTRIYGPNYYAFDYGPVHFIALDDVIWGGKAPQGTGSYTGGLDQQQLDFIRQDLDGVPEDRLVVLMMHIPLTGIANREDLYRLIEQRPYTFSISGHTHWQAHEKITREDGWLGAKPHHHLINVTVSGSWWSGLPDPRGIPHTTMQDGAPNGYTLIRFGAHQPPEIHFKAAGYPDSFQMSVFAPDTVAAEQLEQTMVYVNVFNGWEDSIVQVRWSESAPWNDLSRSVEPDPALVALYETESESPPAPYRRVSAPKDSKHLWKGNLPLGVDPGIQVLHVRATDVNGQWHRAERIVRIVQ